MESDVKNVTIWDTTVPGVGTVQMSVAVPGAQNVPGQNGTLSDFVGNDFAGVPYASYNSSTDYRISTAIVIGAQLYTMNAAIQPDMLAHEMLHITSVRLQVKQNQLVGEIG
jgi:hypothetical protein